LSAAPFKDRDAEPSPAAVTPRSDRAIADYTQAIQLDPKSGRAYYGRGLVYRKKGDTDRAIADFTQAIKLDPKSAHEAGIDQMLATLQREAAVSPDKTVMRGTQLLEKCTSPEKANDFACEMYLRGANEMLFGLHLQATFVKGLGNLATVDSPRTGICIPTDMTQEQFRDTIVRHMKNNNPVTNDILAAGLSIFSASKKAWPCQPAQ
jgi:tetratricopeptide (TPR) repeat protein